MGIGTVPIVLIVLAAASVALLVFVLASRMIVYVPNSKVGIVEKLWSTGGSISTGILSHDQRAGFQVDLLRGGLHFFAPFQYHIHKVPLVTVPQGRIGYVFARDGKALQSSQVLASNSVANNFEDARSFLRDGQKGPQRKLLREGTYALNLALFVVITGDGASFNIYSHSLSDQDKTMFQGMAKLIADRNGFSPVVIGDSDDTIGIVTIHDGMPLVDGEIIAPMVGDAQNDHNNFQNAEAFVQAGGKRGRQHPVLLEGTYYINRLFATVEMEPKTVIPVGFVGVVVSYTGLKGEDISGDTYRHGELVKQGCKGVWEMPLLPGKYAFNVYAGSVVLVPVTNFILKWANEITASHKLDENLSEVSLITRDAFEPTLPLSVVLHIDYRKAPLVIQRFGDIKKLVEQTLDPMVSAYFKNIGQNRTLIELLQDRSQIQNQASQEMRDRFAMYNLELQEVLIGTPHPPKTSGTDHIEQILAQLRDRQVAREQVETYKLQQLSAEQERSLREAEAKAGQQGEITKSSLAIEINENMGKAALAKAQQDAERVRVEARANAERLKQEGEGEASKVQQIGLANAAATAKQVEAYGGPQYQMLQQVMNRIAEAAENGHLALVPQIMVNGSGAGGTSGAPTQGGGLIDGLLAMMLSDKLNAQALPKSAGKPAET